MPELVPDLPAFVPAMSDAAIAQVRRLERAALARPQVATFTHHVIHAGLYARTIFVPAGLVITGALVKRATLLIVQGDCAVHVGGPPIELRGYNVLPARAHRKQAFLARSDLHITMVFPTDASSVEDAERQFTDETGLLASHRDHACNLVTITEE